MPDKEVPNVGRSAFIKRIIVAMGGRAAEKLIFDEYSAGAQGDIEHATRIARSMVAVWGMSETVGPVSFKQSEEHPFLGKEMHSSREFSEDTARIIDIEVQSILKECNARAIEMLQEFRKPLDTLAEELLEHEDIEHNDLIRILGPRPGEETAVADSSGDTPPVIVSKDGDDSGSDTGPTESDTIAGSDTRTDTHDPTDPSESSE